MMHTLLALLMLIGSLFMFFAALGAIRFPDSLTRLAAISKSSSLALVLMATVAGIWFGTLDSLLKMAALVTFVLLTSPVSAHLMARSAKARQIPLSGRTHGLDHWSGSKPQKD
ncbi:MAG: monovalent cation/H(+) antiporter subunit G [Calothrix sp. SM1_5_4]|nr:monovalent cation/H(+) antiporter subunit G [Calothrix sp. SM1_5_4]